MASPDGSDIRDLLQRIEERLSLIEQQQEWLARNQEQLDQRLQRVENSVVFRTLRAVGGFAEVQKRALGQKLLHSPLHPLYAKLAGPSQATLAYREWIDRQAALLPSRDSHEQEAATWNYRPLISIIMATKDPNRAWFEAAVQSVKDQTYTNHELIIVDDASESTDWLSEHATVRSDEPVGISGALNRAAARAHGDYIGVLDHDDLLSPYALHYCVEALQESRPAIVYTDEDFIDEEGQAVRPNFKPDWSPELLSTCMYFGHFVLIRRDAFEATEGFRSEYDGSQDFDLVLRLVDSGADVRHVPRVLYRWRQHDASTAKKADAKPYAQEAGLRAIEETMRRRGELVDVTPTDLPNRFSISRSTDAKATIVICTRSADLLGRCLRSLPGADVIVVHHVTSGRDDDEIRRLAPRRVEYSGEFNFAAMNNLGAREVESDVIVFLNDDIEGGTEDWLRLLTAQVMRPEIGIAGPKLLYPSGAIQHAGITLGIVDGAGHPGRNLFQSDFWPWLDYTRDVTAVTGACLAIRRQVFTELNGFDEQFAVNYNDVDLCLRARMAGYRVLYESGAVLKHYEAQTRRAGTHARERQLFFERWKNVLHTPDPYYSPHLTVEHEDTSLRP